MVRLVRRRNPDKGLKLIGDAAAAEVSGAKYFLAMLKHHCNPADLEAMALLQEISGGPSPPDGRWKNHNLRRLRYLVKQDLDNIAWLYWLDDGDDNDIPLLSVQNPHICIWEVGCRRYGLDTKEIIHYCSAECRIRHEFDLWMRKFRQQDEHRDVGASINMNIIYLECKLLDITKCGFDFIGMSGCRRCPMLPPLFYLNDCGG
jgi:hypothetical protein